VPVLMHGIIADAFHLITVRPVQSTT
jgi:hypothetical protein